MKAAALNLSLSVCILNTPCCHGANFASDFQNAFTPFIRQPFPIQSGEISPRKRRSFVKSSSSIRRMLVHAGTRDMRRKILAFCHRSRTHPKSASSLSMSLIPVPINELSSIIPTPTRLAPTGDQYVNYLGRTPRERFNTLFEGFSIAFLGSMFAYFISFVIGQFLATLLGIIFLFWPILSPEFKAYQRNWELVGGRDLVDVWMDDEDGFFRGIPSDKRGLYGAYYVTRIEDVCVVDDVLAPAQDEYDLDEFSGYTMDKDELESITGIPWKLRLRLLDEENREMQIHCRMSEDYLDIKPGMHMIGVLLSTSKEFAELAGMSDFCVLDEEGPVAWVGDYPYLDKNKFMRTLDSNGVMDTIMSDYEDNYFDKEDEEALSYPSNDPIDRL